MRRRDVLATLPLGLLGLAACGPEEGGPETPTAAPPVEHTEPVPVGERAEVVEIAETILKVAKKDRTDLIVLGSHGRGAVKGILLGSVSSKVIAQSDIPVTIVR